MKVFYIILLIWNFIVFCIYGIDKGRAGRAARRIREATLIAVSYIFGSAGAMFGMVVFNHKTSKIKFRILVPLSVVFNCVLFYFLSMYIFN